MTVARIDACFARLKKEGRAAFIAYHMAHDPDRGASLAVMRALAESGADIIELGMPFSDPVAEGPVIQRAAVRALEAGGSMCETLSLLREFRENNQETPVILMGYFNPILRYGVARFVENALSAGADGVIIVDLPYEEEEEFTAIASPAGLALIRLVAPTTGKERAVKTLKNAAGFVYCISVAGVTGTKSPEMKKVAEKVKEIKSITGVPVVVGFGIKTPEQAREAAAIADGIVVGSAIVRVIEESRHGGTEKIASSVGALLLTLCV